MNITLSIDEEVVRRARAVVSRQGKSLNQAVRDHLAFLASRGEDGDPAGDLFSLMDEGKGRTKGKRWTREELHEG